MMGKVLYVDVKMKCGENCWSEGEMGENFHDLPCTGEMSAF